MATPDLSTSLYAALAGSIPITALLPNYGTAGKSIFTNRPVPADMPYPMIVTAGNVSLTDQDLIASPVIVIVRDISIFGLNTTDPNASTPNQTRLVETIAGLVRDLFHRQRNSITVPGWSVMDIVCTGPMNGPVDDDQSVHRLVTLTIRLS